MRMLIALILLGLSVPAQADERQIRRDCTYDALRFCKAAIATAGRAEIINCIVANRDKLQAKCSRHIY